MFRPRRIEFSGALYHVMARGDACAAIFLDDADREAFCAGLFRVAERFQWRVWAYCLMDNHYHVLVETLQPTLSRGMREVDGVYTQALNRYHGRVGHVLQGRYKAILVDRDSYLLELSRYIVLNPLRARVCGTAADSPWSSCRMVMGKVTAPDTLALFSAGRGVTRQAFARFVAEGGGLVTGWQAATVPRRRQICRADGSTRAGTFAEGTAKTARAEVAGAIRACRGGS